jgi:hypothetical protein
VLRSNSRCAQFHRFSDTEYALAGAAASEYSRCNPHSTGFASTSAPTANRCRDSGFGITTDTFGESGRQDLTHYEGAAVVMNRPLFEHRTEMRPRHRDHPVQVLPLDRSDHALPDRVRLGLVTGDRNTSTPRAPIESSRCFAKALIYSIASQGSTRDAVHVGSLLVGLATTTQTSARALFHLARPL